MHEWCTCTHQSSGGATLTGLDICQVLVYFAVAKKGELPTDGKTDLNPEGLTAAHGIHAESIAGLLHSNGLSCSLPSRPDFVKAMLEKLVWIRCDCLLCMHPSVMFAADESFCGAPAARTWWWAPSTSAVLGK